MQEKCAIFEKNQLSIVNYQLYFVPLKRCLKTLSRTYFRSKIKINCILFCILLAYSYLCTRFSHRVMVN